MKYKCIQKNLIILSWGGLAAIDPMNRNLLIIYILVIFILPAWGQEGMYYYGTNSRPVSDREEAVLLKEVEKRCADTYLMKTRRKDGNAWQLVSREKIKIRPDGDQVIRYRANSFFPVKIIRKMERQGSGELQFSEYVQETVVREGTSASALPLHLEGTVREYHPNGKLKSVAIFMDNQLVSNQNWLPDGSPYIDSLFYSADREPEYQMGDDFFKKFLLQKLQTSGIDLTQIQDRVVIGWVVMETGKIDGVIALEGRARQLNNYLVQVIKELPGTWEPALLAGKPVRYFMSIPLNFTSREANFQELDLSTGRLHYSKY